MYLLSSVLVIIWSLFVQFELNAQDEYPLSSTQRTAMKKVLKDSTGWRVSRTSDCTDASLSDWQKEERGYFPYFVCADFNEDGRKDFILGFIHDDKLSVLYFLGTRNGYSSPRFLLSADYYKTCGLFLQGKRLLYGDFYSDNAVSFIWDSVMKKFKQEHLSEEEGD
jgi:hypothetical protein